jgi:hypothetical protein
MPLSRQNKITVAGSRDEIPIIDPYPDPAGMDEDQFMVFLVKMFGVCPGVAGIDPADPDEIGQFRITFQNLIERQRGGGGIGFMGGPDFNLIFHSEKVHDKSGIVQHLASWLYGIDLLTSIQ